MEVTLSTGDSDLATGRGSKVMGNPLAAVAWLCGHLTERGRSLEKDEVVLTGSQVTPSSPGRIPGTGQTSATWGRRVRFVD